MILSEVDYLVYKERNKDLRQEVVRHQLIKIAMLRRPNNRESLRRMVGRIGAQMVKWGWKLQGYNQGQHQTVIQHGL